MEHRFEATRTTHNDLIAADIAAEEAIQPEDVIDALVAKGIASAIRRHATNGEDIDIIIIMFDDVTVFGDVSDVHYTSESMDRKVNPEYHPGTYPLNPGDTLTVRLSRESSRTLVKTFLLDFA